MMPLPRLELLPSAMTTDLRWEVYNGLMSCSRGLPNDEALAQMLATQINGGGALPVGFGLTPGAFAALLTRHFPGFIMPTVALRLLQPWDLRLAEELQELVKLLQIYRAGQDKSEDWLSAIIATGCMNNDHLWEDLGLWSRRDLSELMLRNFPVLAAKNDRDMKWKKFLYKQLCLQEGVYLCRAPSCAICRDYSLCFGSEE
jgi:nitrogen fixation protein NifQ